MSNNILGVGVTGLKVSQTGLSTVGHNIANSGTDGYSRQRINTVTNPATLQSGNYIGSGANVESTDRVVDQFVVGQLRTDTTMFKDLDGFYNQIEQLDSLLADESTGLSGSLNNFFASLNNGANDPTAISSRQLVISESENLADRFNTIFGRLDVIGQGVESGMEVAIEKINALASDIARLNATISDALGKGIGAQPNDLLDRRELALNELSGLVPTQIFDQGNGQLNVLIASGQSLVVGSESRQLDLVPSIVDTSTSDVVFLNANSVESITPHIKGGMLGGLLRFRNQTLELTYNELGRTAIALSDSFNQAHQNGLDLGSTFGGLFFRDINEESIAEDRVIDSSNNSQSSNRRMALYVSDSNQLKVTDYKVTIEGGGRFRINRDSDDQEVAVGILSGSLPLSVEFEGLALTFASGTYAAGDIFTLKPLHFGADTIQSALASSENLAFASPLVTDASLGNRGTGKISGGELLRLNDLNGDPLPLFASPGVMDPPMVVVFTSPTTYDILDNSDPSHPIPLVPPIRDQAYTPGVSNALFTADPGETQVTTRGEIIGLPDGSVAVNQPLATFSNNLLVNGYPSELIRFSRASVPAGGTPTVISVITAHNASADVIATQFNGIPGVHVNAMSNAEISDLNIGNGSPVQISLNGQDLIEYRNDPVTGLPAFAPGVPDPVTAPDDFYDYLSDRINQNLVLKSLGVVSIAAADELSGATELHIHSSSGVNLTVGFIGNLADTISVNDGENDPVIIAGQGDADIGHVVVGGKLDIRLADGLSISSVPPDSLLFGDHATPGFALSSYFGIGASISGSPDTGDRYTLDFNQDASLDSRNALNLVNLKDAKLLAGGIMTLNKSYAGLVQQIGIETSSAKINRDASEQVLQQTEKLKDSISGVNLDEEAADLIRFQQLFSANAQVISVARDIFDKLLNAF